MHLKVVENNHKEPLESQKQVKKEAAQTALHSSDSLYEKCPGDSYCSETPMQTAKETTRNVASSSATIGALKTGESPRPANSSPRSLKTKWTRWFTHTSSTIKEFWALDKNVFHPSKMPAGAEFYCFKHGIAPVPEDPVCANGGRWMVSCSRGSADTCWKLTLLALTEEQFDDSDDICGTTLNVQEKQEKISLWTKNGLNGACQLRIGKQWKKLLNYNDNISFILHDDDAESFYQV